MIYITGYVCSVLSFLFFRNQLKSGALYFMVSVVPLSIALLRGHVGTDTQAYIDIIGLIEQGINASVEIGFYESTKFLLTFTNDGLFITKLLAF